MRIELLRSGGLANLRLRTSLDTDELAPAEAREIALLIDGIDLSDLSSRSPIRGPGADRYQYDLTVTRGTHQQQVSVAEGALSPNLRALIDRLLDEHTRRGRG